MKCYIFKSEDIIILDIRATTGNDYEIMEEIHNRIGNVSTWLEDGQTKKKFLRVFL